MRVCIRKRFSVSEEEFAVHQFDLCTLTPAPQLPVVIPVSPHERLK